MSNNTGGPAFPKPDMVDDGALISQGSTGMTLRDYFAGKAMQALITGPDVMDDHYEEETNEYVAKRSYFIADAMLKARQA